MGEEQEREREHVYYICQTYFSLMKTAAVIKRIRLYRKIKKNYEPSVVTVKNLKLCENIFFLCL